jgi:hypothetical protein
MYSRYSVISPCHWSSWFTECPGTRYSASNRPIWSICTPVRTGLDEYIGGRGPVFRRSRPELQAMSNSLQLT